MQFLFFCFLVNSEPGTKVIKTTTTYTSKNPVSRELHFESPDTSSINRSVRHQSPSYETRTIESSTKRNVSYNDDGLYGKPRRTVSPTPVSNNQHYVTETRTRTISPTPVKNTERYITETRTVNNEVVPIPKNANYNEVVRVENTTGPSALNDMQLSDDILPKPKTKVTTTVRTYTYEIPEDGSLGYPADRDPPKNTAVFYKTERNERSANYYPNQSPPVNPNSFTPLSIQEAPPHNTTTVYKYDVTNTTSGQPQPQIPPGGITIYPPQNTTIYKTETINTTNKQYRSPTPNSYPESAPIVQYPAHGHPNHGPQIHTQTHVYPNNGHPNNGYPNNGHPPPNGWSPTYQPNEPSVVVYKQTTTNTRNVIHPRQEREPLLHPFPVDGPIITEVDGSPPKRVEDLMASFGDVRVFLCAFCSAFFHKFFIFTNPKTSEIHYTNKKVQIAEKPLTPNHNLSSTATNVYSSEPEDKSKALVASKNITGPPVYYPPNHELFSAKEEASYRAQVNVKELLKLYSLMIKFDYLFV